MNERCIHGRWMENACGPCKRAGRDLRREELEERWRQMRQSGSDLTRAEVCESPEGRRQAEINSGVE